MMPKVFSSFVCSSRSIVSNYILGVYLWQSHINTTYSKTFLWRFFWYCSVHIMLYNQYFHYVLVETIKRIIFFIKTRKEVRDDYDWQGSHISNINLEQIVTNLINTELNIVSLNEIEYHVLYPSVIFRKIPASSYLKAQYMIYCSTSRIISISVTVGLDPTSYPCPYMGNWAPCFFSRFMLIVQKLPRFRTISYSRLLEYGCDKACCIDFFLIFLDEYIGGQISILLRTIAGYSYWDFYDYSYREHLQILLIGWYQITWNGRWVYSFCIQQGHKSVLEDGQYSSAYWYLKQKGIYITSLSGLLEQHFLVYGDKYRLLQPNGCPAFYVMLFSCYFFHLTSLNNLRRPQERTKHKEFFLLYMFGCTD